MEFSEQIDDLLFMGHIEGDAILTLHHLLKSHEQGQISAEKIQSKIDSIKSEFYSKLIRCNSQEY